MICEILHEENTRGKHIVEKDKKEEGFGLRTPSVLGSGGNALVLLNINFLFSNLHGSFCNVHHLLLNLINRSKNHSEDCATSK